MAMNEVTLTDVQPVCEDGIFSANLDKNLVAESERAYLEITRHIVDISEEQLDKHTEDKNSLRVKLLRYIKIFLVVQFAFLIFFLIFNQTFSFQISDFVFNVYIVSVFVETLGGLLVMVRYAFASEQEVKLIEILTAIVGNFKKYNDDDNEKKEKSRQREEETHVR